MEARPAIRNHDQRDPSGEQFGGNRHQNRDDDQSSYLCSRSTPPDRASSLRPSSCASPHAHRARSCADMVHDSGAHLDNDTSQLLDYGQCPPIPHPRPGHHAPTERLLRSGEGRKSEETRRGSSLAQGGMLRSGAGFERRLGGENRADRSEFVPAPVLTFRQRHSSDA